MADDPNTTVRHDRLGPIEVLEARVDDLLAPRLAGTVSWAVDQELGVHRLAFRSESVVLAGQDREAAIPSMSTTSRLWGHFLRVTTCSTHASSRARLEPKLGGTITSVVAVIDGELPGPTTLLRADMDALPVGEDTGLDVASEIDGVMHACGRPSVRHPYLDPYASGVVALRPGAMLVSADRAEATVRGRGGHSTPHLALDPATVTAEFILACNR